ncbi:MAG: hypothetical protein AAGD32_04990 [Planctomycetota bacterium]
MTPVWGHDDIGRVRLFRRHVKLKTPGQFRLFAEGVYHVWLNGEFLGRGPVPHHPDELLYDTYDLPAGDHVVTVLVYVPGVSTLSYVPTGRPGLWSEILVDGEATPGTWKTTGRTGYGSDVPRRTLLLGHVEHLDLAAHPVGWEEPTFNDTTWSTAEPIEPPPYLRPPESRPVPMLRHESVWANHIGTFALTKPPLPLAPGSGTIDKAGVDGTAAYGNDLMDAGWTPTESTDGNVALVYDLGAEHVGEPLLELTSASPGTIDFGFAELLDDHGRPALMMKGGSYANRIETPGGNVNFAGIGYSGIRYLAVMLREFDGPVDVRRVGVRASTLALRFSTPPRSGHADLDCVVELCARTVRVGVQESLIDCPTREQAMYLGDGHLIARWLLRLTGDASHWKRLVRAQFHRPAANGLIRTVVFSAAPVMLLDYNLLGIIGTRDYLAHTGDLNTVRTLLPTACDVYGWFERQLDNDGLLRVDLSSFDRGQVREETYDPALPDGEAHRNLFIDHAGMGWHNVGEPGIDRTGTNTAINALLSMAECALADMGEESTLRRRSERRRSTARAAFYDGILFRDGAGSDQISQQTNVWATLAGWMTPTEAATALEPLFADPSEKVARCGPYFWAYAILALRYAGLESLARREVVRLWQPMLDADATTLWETFNGDAYDSRCHPWSAAPLDLVYSPNSHALTKTPSGSSSRT